MSRFSFQKRFVHKKYIQYFEKCIRISIDSTFTLELLKTISDAKRDSQQLNRDFGLH